MLLYSFPANLTTKPGDIYFRMEVCGDCSIFFQKLNSYLSWLIISQNFKYHNSLRVIMLPDFLWSHVMRRLFYSHSLFTEQIKSYLVNVLFRYQELKCVKNDWLMRPSSSIVFISRLVLVFYDLYEGWRTIQHPEISLTNILMRGQFIDLKVESLWPFGDFNCSKDTMSSLHVIRPL